MKELLWPFKRLLNSTIPGENLLSHILAKECYLLAVLNKAFKSCSPQTSQLPLLKITCTELVLLVSCMYALFRKRRNAGTQR